VIVLKTRIERLFSQCKIVECIKSRDLHPIGFLKVVISGALAELVPGENWDDDLDRTSAYRNQPVQD
jgi:hypothetical protein